MRRAALLIWLLVASLALPPGARADTGWSLDNPGFTGGAVSTPVPPRAETLAPEGRHGPRTVLAALVSTAKVAPEGERRGSRASRAALAAARADGRRGPRAVAERSRARALGVAALGFARATARARLGVPGHHNSPPPPSS